MARVAVIGAGVMGLAAGYRAARDGHEVTVFEAGPEPGGMAAHFDFDGLSLERFYHFVSHQDEPIFALMQELGIADRLRWRSTTMGYLIGGRLHDWGDPLSLLRFTELDLVSKLRYGLMVVLATRRQAWGTFDAISAREWLTRWCGPKVYQQLWAPLFNLKFHEHADAISAAWIWARIRRLARSRRSLLKEELGFIEGGSGVLIEALARAIRAEGGTIRLAARVAEVLSDEGRVRGLRLADGAEHGAEHVISTVPAPLVSAMVPSLPADVKGRYDAIENIGVAGVVFKLKRSVSPHLWVNIAEPDLAVPGLIEYTNLRPVDDVTIVYVPCYMPRTHPQWSWPDQDLIALAFRAVRRVNPEVTEEDRIAVRVSRLPHAQPICPKGFAAMLPPVQTPIAGLQVADTAFYYPEDRGIAESIRLGMEMAGAVSGGPPAIGLPRALRGKHAA